MNRLPTKMAIILILTFTGNLPADEVTAPITLIKKPTSRKLSKEKNNPPPPTTNPLDNELLKDLTEKNKEPFNKDRLKQLIKTLEQAEAEISQKKTGVKTQQLQKNVVKHLDWLISLAEKQQKIRGTQKQVQQEASTKQKPTTPPNQQKPNQQGNKNKEKKTSNSEETIRKTELKTTKLMAKKMLEKDVWGHLPPTLRKKLLNIYSEKYLPEYNDVVRKYFESLAEEGRKERPD